jgi:hypothetical protein
MDSEINKMRQQKITTVMLEQSISRIACMPEIIGSFATLQGVKQFLRETFNLTSSGGDIRN